MTSLIEDIDALLRLDPFDYDQSEKERTLTPILDRLTQHHRAHSADYARTLDVMWPSFKQAKTLADIPWLPVGLFKSHRLASVPAAEVFKTLTSSGTTGQQVSRIFLDKDTARRQTLALSSIMQSVLGKQRLPMLVIDTQSLIKDRASFSARGAGVVGMLNFGRDHVYTLDDGMRLDRNALSDFLAKHGGQPFIMFGFTWMVWKHFFQELDKGTDLSNATLVHSGGWKKLADEAISNERFKQLFRERTGLSRIFNFYGMVEQVGSVFLEGEDGHLRAPRFADVIVRDPVTWLPAPDGTEGVVQVLSALPTSYPGHSILTEDRGVIHSSGKGGKGGKRFSILGRLPRAELRGCSDVHAFASPAA